jgi:hypothetical protein
MSVPIFDENTVRQLASEESFYRGEQFQPRWM